MMQAAAGSVLSAADVARIASPSTASSSNTPGDQGVAFIVAAAGAVPGGQGTVSFHKP